MNLRSLFVLALALAAAPAWAGPTGIAQVPLLNINGTGAVKPNLMLLFDNSGSMDQSYTPDYVNDSLCRRQSSLASGTQACNVGMPPFMSPDFNKQYYNPAIRYQAPVKADGSFYADMNSANTSGWTVVTADGFNARKLDLYGSTSSTINLLTGFPDLRWCNPSNLASCQRNTGGYTYPDNTYTTAQSITGNPYYYQVNVAEYCADANLTTCRSVAVGATAPAGYPYPAKVRWCDTTLLTRCQGKRVGVYIYPRYSTALGAVVSYGTIAIGASSTTNSLSISSVTIPDPSTARTITNGSVTAATGTDTLLKQQTLASALAASIIAKTGLTTQYWACVRNPVGQPSVQPCANFGITLGADNVVAVIAITCNGSKSLANCAFVTDNSRAGWAMTVTAPSIIVTPATAGSAAVPTTATLGVSGSTPNTNPTPTLASISWNGITLATNIAIGKGKTASNAVSTLVSAINTSAPGNIRAYVGGNSVTSVCASKSSSVVCLVDTAATANIGNLTYGSMTNAGSMTFSAVGGSGYAAAVAPTPAVTDAIPVTTAALSAGSAPPDTFQRVDIVPTTTTYPKAAGRGDCVTTPGVCTYAEEMTNFANWYAYYKTRIQMMKTSAGIAFSALNQNYRVGYAKLSTMGAGSPVEMKPADFTSGNRATWYSTLYGAVTSGSTPSRLAVDAVGKMFANQSPYNYGAGAEVVQYPCQQNFLVYVTDGYWNGGYPSIANNDNTENASRFCTAARGCVDSRSQSQPSLADVTLYWYNGGSATSTVSLRPSLETDMSRPGLVPAGPGENTHLHVNAYMLGLGVDGVMSYEPNYDTAPRVGGDFYNLITGATSGCPWNNGGAYVWPDPDVTNTASTVQERVDDMWHAAVNGHGKYFSAQDPTEVVQGLSAAIAAMQVRIGAAAAAATSTPNISQQDNDIFSDTFTTVRWYGELSDKKIDIATGVVSNTAVWNTSDRLGRQVSAASDSRTLYMLDTAGASPALKSFRYSAMNAQEKAWFDNKCASLSQCTLLSASDKAIVNSGANLVDYLRGQQQYADDSLFRAFTQTSYTPAGASGPIPIILGDIASSKPAYLRDSRKSYSATGYADFKVATASRAATVFTAANDGMLHAFNATTGDELWGYLPRITMSKLYNLASTTYGSNHIFTTDGSPEIADVQIGGVWKSVLVAGLNGGGRGYYALDVTDPANPHALWEFCADSSICSKGDPDLGLSFGNPQFGQWNGQWVVLFTSGYNNIPGSDGVASGDGKGYLYVVDVATGNILRKIGTGVGDTTTPSGFAKITAITNNPFLDPGLTYVYGGDNTGKMWRFDFTAASGITVSKLGDAGSSQPITTRPDVTLCSMTSGASSVAQRVILWGTGRLLDVPDTADTSTQSLYLVKDGASTISLRGTTMVQQNMSLVGSGSNTQTFSGSTNAVDLSTKDGWYIDFDQNSGERINLDPKIIGGAANVVTNTPSSASACSIGGSSNVYQFNVCNGNPVTPDNTIGTTLSNTSAAVGFIIVRLPSGALKMITTTASGATVTTGVSNPGEQGAKKTGWRRVNGNGE
ncbi:pilus assembly protein [Massilia sp. TS11]|uniref:pilus assembly protein n=1 Tax=Massilia sp. TS11 TaxID=2908003 RepID=UPI001EDC23A9|nr:PilC/PilY family type IV pilus protein [Massilia sp. TS11]MCG2583812.1 hypothetical protein [Massilia sp. TS11]